MSRDTLMLLCGERYPTLMAPWKTCIAAWSRKLRSTPIAAVPLIVEHMREIGKPVDESRPWIEAAAEELEAERR